MHIARALWPSSNGKIYESVYLRESFRQGGKVKKRDIANLTHCDPAEIAAIELALKHKGDLAALASLDGVQLREGASVGAVSGLRPKLPAASASSMPSAPTLPANWRCGRSSPTCWIKARASQPSAWLRCMPPATCWASGAASTKTICTRI